MRDLISRQQAIEAVEKSMYENPHENAIIRGMHDHEHRHFLTILMGLPSAQPERPKGKWIHQVKFSRVECDQCGKVFRNSFAPKNFCPNCGADMRGEQNG